MSLTSVDWSTLPSPSDDGKADHLSGATIKETSLPSTDGTLINLSALRGTTVIYCYPMTGRPDRDLPEGWDMIPGARGCTPQSCAYRDHAADLIAAGVDQIFGVSTQSTSEQTEAMSRLHLPFSLLSDQSGAFTAQMKMPTIEVEGVTMLKRITLILSGATITRVHYPVFPPDQDAQRVLSWLATGQDG